MKGKKKSLKSAHCSEFEPQGNQVNEETEPKSIEQSIMDVWNSAAGEQIKREDDAKWLKTEEKKNLVASVLITDEINVVVKKIVKIVVVVCYGKVIAKI